MQDELFNCCLLCGLGVRGPTALSNNNRMFLSQLLISVSFCSFSSSRPAVFALLCVARCFFRPLRVAWVNGLCDCPSGNEPASRFPHAAGKERLDNFATAIAFSNLLRRLQERFEPSRNTII
jgi:hypothetical protein